MIKVESDFKIKEDIEFVLEAEKISLLELSKETKISRITLNEILKTGFAGDESCEKFYSYIYRNKYRINRVKEEILKEKYECVLFHGSKFGLKDIDINGSRNNCDFGNGFYLGESYGQALPFVCEKDDSCVYSFSFAGSNLKVKRFTCDLEWMLAICHYRGTIKDYATSDKIKAIVSEIDEADVVIAPIADNKMFYIMSLFADGEISADAAIHSLSASSLGLQYVLKTEKALNSLTPIEKYYLSLPEREDCRKELIERAYEVDTKLKLAKREFRSGLYIEEILK